MSASFNPIKEEVGGKRAKSMVWNTDTINRAIKGLEQGKKLIANPFYENNIKLLKGDLVFVRSEEEIEDWKKCREDILYFAEKYCRLMTPEGIKCITLRDYQKRYLTHLTKSQLSIYLSCRQSGKCNSMLTHVSVKFGDTVSESISHTLNEWKNTSYYVESGDYYDVPLFELYNLYEESHTWKQKYNIYKLLYTSPSHTLYEQLSHLNENCDKKILKSHIMDGVKVKSDRGWSPVAYIHETKPFNIYKITTKSGLILECADEHLIYTPSGLSVWAKDLVKGDAIAIDKGVDEIESVIKTDIIVNMCDITVLNNKESYYSNHILSHNTTTSAIYLLHYAIFNVDKNVLVLGNKRKTAVEILDKIGKIYLELPHHLKPGIYKWNESELVFDNGCRIMAEATTINSGIGFTFHCVLCDEFAHVPKNILDEFYNNIFPTITAGKAKFMITSTQKGYNLFYRLYKAAEAGDNDYKPFKTDWYEVPEWNPETRRWEARDDEWKKRQVANYGSEEAFNKQFGTDFDVSALTLIDRSILSKKQREAEIFIPQEMPGVINADYFRWKPGYNPVTDLRKDHIVITCDIAEGGGNDYTVFNIFKLAKCGVCECIGYFRSNKVKMQDCATTLQLLYVLLCNPNATLISIEYNTYGELFLNYMYRNIDKDKILSAFDTGCIVKYYNDTGSNFKLGIKITPGNKTPYCLLFKDSFESGKSIITNADFMSELSNFCNDGKDHYRASFGHDDIIMSAVQLEFVKDTLQYKMMRDEYDMLAWNNAPGLQDYFDSVTQGAYEIYNNEYNNLYNEYDNVNNDNLSRLSRW